MENYESIMGLVEEVRDILSLHEAKKKKAAHPADADPEGHKKVVMGKFKKATPHNPFKRLKKGKALGAGPRGSTTVPGKKRGRYRCRCHSYKCLCRDSETKKIKTVKIEKGWKNTYNIAYRKWRKKHANKYAKDPKWKSVKKGHKAFHAK